ncbi:hypothetical protein CBOM_04080 [Ceraceosorus bombacis]|uniref:Uncharacterized protein n=1 Tax=Ceraceosorus bombacis TaxID=401625 RepID=A0A0P1BMQ2_9BASI|nr:hypothetical protein CBOM_04080 [Ceraceosorus bombacis]
MSAPIRNADGTANVQGLQNEVTKLKGKYAQNAKNFEANTGKPMNIFGSSEEKPAAHNEGQPIRILSHEERKAAATGESGGDQTTGSK